MMFDFIVSALVALATNISIVAPYWDRLREYWLTQGYTATQVNIPYYILCGASYLAVGLVIYGIIWFIRWIYEKIQELG